MSSEINYLFNLKLETVLFFFIILFKGSQDSTRHLNQSGVCENTYSDTSVETSHKSHEGSCVRFNPKVSQHSSTNHDHHHKSSKPLHGNSKKEHKANIKRSQNPNPNRPPDIEVLAQLCGQVLDNARVATPCVSRQGSSHSYQLGERRFSAVCKDPAAVNIPNSWENAEKTPSLSYPGLPNFDSSSSQKLPEEQKSSHRCELPVRTTCPSLAVLDNVLTTNEPLGGVLQTDTPVSELQGISAERFSLSSELFSPIDKPQEILSPCDIPVNNRPVDELCDSKELTPQSPKRLSNESREDVCEGDIPLISPPPECSCEAQEQGLSLSRDNSTKTPLLSDLNTDSQESDDRNIAPLQKDSFCGPETALDELSYHKLPPDILVRASLKTGETCLASHDIHSALAPKDDPDRHEFTPIKQGCSSTNSTFPSAPPRSSIHTSSENKPPTAVGSIPSSDGVPCDSWHASQISQYDYSDAGLVTNLIPPVRNKNPCELTSPKDSCDSQYPKSASLCDDPCSELGDQRDHTLTKQETSSSPSDTCSKTPSRDTGQNPLASDTVSLSTSTLNNAEGRRSHRGLSGTKVEDPCKQDVYVDQCTSSFSQSTSASLVREILKDTQRHSELPSPLFPSDQTPYCPPCMSAQHYNQENVPTNQGIDTSFFCPTGQVLVSQNASFPLSDPFCALPQRGSPWATARGQNPAPTLDASSFLPRCLTLLGLRHTPGLPLYGSISQPTEPKGLSNIQSPRCIQNKYISLMPNPNETFSCPHTSHPNLLSPVQMKQEMPLGSDPLSASGISPDPWTQLKTPLYESSSMPAQTCPSHTSFTGRISPRVNDLALFGVKSLQEATIVKQELHSFHCPSCAPSLTSVYPENALPNLPDVCRCTSCHSPYPRQEQTFEARHYYPQQPGASHCTIHGTQEPTTFEQNALAQSTVPRCQSHHSVSAIASAYPNLSSCASHHSILAQPNVPGCASHHSGLAQHNPATCATHHSGLAQTNLTTCASHHSGFGQPNSPSCASYQGFLPHQNSSGCLSHHSGSAQPPSSCASHKGDVAQHNSSSCALHKNPEMYQPGSTSQYYPFNSAMSKPENATSGPQEAINNLDYWRRNYQSISPSPEQEMTQSCHKNYSAPVSESAKNCLNLGHMSCNCHPCKPLSDEDKNDSVDSGSFDEAASSNPQDYFNSNDNTAARGKEGMQQDPMQRSRSAEACQYAGSRSQRCRILAPSLSSEDSDDAEECMNANRTPGMILPNLEKEDQPPPNFNQYPLYPMTSENCKNSFIVGQLSCLSMPPLGLKCSAGCNTDLTGFYQGPGISSVMSPSPSYMPNVPPKSPYVSRLCSPYNLNQDQGALPFNQEPPPLIGCHTGEYIQYNPQVSQCIKKTNYPRSRIQDKTRSQSDLQDKLSKVPSRKCTKEQAPLCNSYPEDFLVRSVPRDNRDLVSSNFEGQGSLKRRNDEHILDRRHWHSIMQDRSNTTKEPVCAMARLPPSLSQLKKDNDHFALLKNYNASQSLGHCPINVVDLPSAIVSRHNVPAAASGCVQRPTQKRSSTNAATDTVDSEDKLTW